jgi:DNA-binding IclR family transcriptional regulator
MRVSAVPQSVDAGPPRSNSTRWSALDAELAEVERLGFAVDNEENEDGVRCIGAPVFGVLGRVIGGAGVERGIGLVDREDSACPPRGRPGARRESRRWPRRHPPRET